MSLAISDSRSSQGSELLGKRKLPATDPTEQKEMSAEPAPLSFNAEGLCNAIVFGSDANEIVATTPDILSSLVHFRLKDLLASLQLTIAPFEAKDQQKIERTVKILYSMSLRNSGFTESAKTLEKDLPLFLNLSKKEHFADLIRRATAALAEQPKETVVGIEEQLSVAYKFIEEITQQLNLFWFTDLDNQERIENVITFTKDFGGAYTFPQCKRFFPQLCQNLAICQNERAELNRLRNAFLSRANELRLKAAPLHAPVREIPLAPHRKSLYENHSRVFWDVGAHILEKAFRVSFEEKWSNKGVYLPDSFANAVKRASRLDGYRHLNFNKLLYEEMPALPERFVSEVWSGFLGPASPFGATDDFIRYVLSQLPQATFDKLVNDIKPDLGRCQMVHDTISTYLEREIRGKMTFMSLKRFLDGAKV